MVEPFVGENLLLSLRFPAFSSFRIHCKTHGGRKFVYSVAFHCFHAQVDACWCVFFFSNFLCIGIKRRSPLKTPATRPTFLPSTADVLRATTITHRPASNRTATKAYFLPLNSGRRAPRLQAITAVSQTAISSNSSHCRMHSINGCS